MKRGQGDAEHLGDLGLLEAGEESEFHAGRRTWIQLLELSQGFVDVQHVDLDGLRQPCDRRQRYSDATSTTLLCMLAASMIDQNSPQLPGGDRKKMSPVLPVDGLGRKQSSSTARRPAPWPEACDRVARDAGSKPPGGAADRRRPSSTACPLPRCRIASPRAERSIRTDCSGISVFQVCFRSRGCVELLRREASRR